MATSVMSQQQSSRSMMTQSYKREISEQSFKIKSPDSDFKDVEADFQSLVNEMAKDGGSSNRVIQQEQRNFSSSSQYSISNGKPYGTSSSSMTSSSSTKSMNNAKPHQSGIVKAKPARVITADTTDYTRRGGGESEIIAEKGLRVRDRIKNLEKQLSQEDLANSPVPEALMSPRYKSGSIKNLAEQFTFAQNDVVPQTVNAQAFSQAKDSVELINSSTDFKGVRKIASAFDKAEISSQEDVSSRNFEDDFKTVKVKETASKFLEPIQVQPPPPKPQNTYNPDEDTEEFESPVAVLPPATMRKTPSSPPVRPPAPNTWSAPAADPIYSKVVEQKKLENSDLQTFEEALSGFDQQAEVISNDSRTSTTEDTTTVQPQQPIQYSAKVTCEVRSRVNTPDIVDNQSSYMNTGRTSESISEKRITTTTKRSVSESRTSSTSSYSSGSRNVVASSQQMASVGGKSASYVNPPSPSSYSSTTTGKPPISDFSEPNKFSLLRSSSTGSVAVDLTDSSKNMTRIGSEKDLPKFNIKKIRPVAPRVWSPGRGNERGRQEEKGPSKLEYKEAPSFSDMPTVWTPSRAGSASPSLGRKEYRKVQYDGQQSLSRRTSQENVSAPRPEDSFAWKDRETEKYKHSLPRSQTPTVTLLQKKREGMIPNHRPEYLREEQGLYKPSDKLYTIKREYESEDEESGNSRRFAVLGPRKIEGVGPTTADGMPVSLKTGIKSEHQGEWYKRMFDSLHKVKDVRYGSSGYMSEPEGGYDSDLGGWGSRYSTLDRRGRRHGPAFDWDPSDTLSRDDDYGTTERNVKRYVHQPGRIENYVPGFSSLSEKELRANPEVEYKLETKSQQPPRSSSNHRYNASRGHMSNALKESGYESDSTLVFRKQSERRPENRDVSELYRQIQKGGEVPLEGLRKPAPRRPKDSPYKYETSEVNIHYKTPVRIEQKEHIPNDELIRRQEEHMRRVYEQERRKKYLSELEDIERRRHTDNFTPLQKSPIPLNRYDDEIYGTKNTRQIARALFNFNAQNKRELSFNKGDIITIRRQVDKNWNEGEIKGAVGIFPSSYVEMLSADNLKPQNARKSSEGQARARFAFQAQTAMEMSLSKGEMVVLTRRVDENWFEGRIGQRRGIFPVSYVEVLLEPGDKGVSPSCSPLPRPALPASVYNGGLSSAPRSGMNGTSSLDSKTTSYSQQLSVNTQQEAVPYRALYNYKPQNEDELELREGDVVMVMEKCDDGWYVGTSRRTSLFGTFPGNYVERAA